MIYGRYNEATLLPILVAGVVALVTVPLDRRRILVMLTPIAVLWTVPYIAWDAALRNTEPVNFNILGVAPIVALGHGVQPLTIALVHGLAAGALILVARRRPHARAGGAARRADGRSASAIEAGLFRSGSRDRASQQQIVSTLEQLETGRAARATAACPSTATRSTCSPPRATATASTAGGSRSPATRRAPTSS